MMAENTKYEKLKKIKKIKERNAKALKFKYPRKVLEIRRQSLMRQNSQDEISIINGEYIQRVGV